MKIGKLENDQLLYAESVMKIGNNWVANPTDEMLISDGYKEVVSNPYPEIIEGFRIEELITEADVITISYNLIELPIYENQIPLNNE